MVTAKSTSFDGQHNLEYTDTGKTHIYRLDGIRVPGATTVGACYPKGEGLIRWMVKQGIEEFDNKTKMRAAAAIGKVVHKYAECHMQNEEFNWALVDGADDAAIIRSCIQQYDAWVAAHPDDKCNGTELLVASPTLKVATQIDLVVERNGEIITRDYKTGKKIYISALHQTVLGRRMLREWLNIESTKLEVLKFSKDPDAIPFEYCTVDNTGLCINGEVIEYPSLLDELDAQVARNVGTYRHTKSVEKLLDAYYESKR